MADTVASTEPQTSAPQPAPVLASIEGLDAAMAAARQTAGSPETSPQAAPEGASAAGGSPPLATPVQPASEEDAPEDSDEGTPPADPSQPARPSRMGRLREQLTQAEQAKRDAEAKLNERLGADLKVRQKYANLLGSAEEKHQLEGVLANPASPNFEVQQARTRLAQMKQAQDELAPIYKAVEEDVFAGFVRGLEKLRTLDGMDEAAHQSLYKAPSGVDALKLMHGIGVKAAEEQFKGEIASLKAQVSDLRTKLAARGAQPAPGGGLAPGGTNGLAGLLGPDGLPTEEAIARARAGGLRNLGKPVAA